MKEHRPNPAETPEGNITPLPALRMTPQLATMIAIALLALALPITILCIGVIQMTRHPANKEMPQATPENPGLRALLEKVADEKLSPASLADDRGQVILFEKTADRQEVLKRIEATAQALGGSVATSKEGEGITVQIPLEAANRFQAIELAKGKIISEPSRKGSRLIYQIRFE